MRCDKCGSILSIEVAEPDLGIGWSREKADAGKTALEELVRLANEYDRFIRAHIGKAS